MSVDFETGQIIYFVAFGLFALLLLSRLFRSGRLQALRNASVWVLIFFGIILLYGMWGDIRATIQPQQAMGAQGEIVLPRQQDGHYYVTAMVNQEPVRFVIDTGATDIVLTQSDAQKIGFVLDDLKFIGTAFTANGQVRTARVRLDSFDIGTVETAGISASVNEGEMTTSLLGMAYLSRFSSIQILSDRMILTP